ncbi:MAG: small multi-drug export protein [Clostridia bacterium]|nr:small multi-drug export protein [Clostridia bacterium]
MSGIIDKIVFGLQDLIRNDYVVTFIISMIPMIEVRGAIPVALKVGMNPWVAYFFSCVSALLICPVLFFFLKPLLNALKRTRLFKNIAAAIEDSFKGKAKKIEDKADSKIIADEKKIKRTDFYKMLGLFVFVAIPLPMTGVWTGTAVAVFLNMDMKKSFIPLVLGNFVAGLIIITASLLLGERSYLVIIILFAFMLISIIGLVLTVLLKKRKKAPRAVYTDKED